MRARKTVKVIKDKNLTTKYHPDGKTGIRYEPKPEVAFYCDEAREKAIAVLTQMGGQHEGDKVWFREYLTPVYPLKETAPRATVYYDLMRGTWKPESGAYIAQNQKAFNELQVIAHVNGVFAGVLIREKVSDCWIPDWAKAVGAV